MSSPKLSANIGLDVIDVALGVVPIPGLHFAFTVLKTIWNKAQTIQEYRFQMTELVASISHILLFLNTNFSAEMDLEDATLNALSDFVGLLNEVQADLERYKSARSLILKSNVQSMINDYCQRIATFKDTLKITALIDIQARQRHDERTRTLDHQKLESEVAAVRASQSLIVDLFMDFTSNKRADLTLDPSKTRIKSDVGATVVSELSADFPDYVKQKSPTQQDGDSLDPPPSYHSSPRADTAPMLPYADSHAYHDVWESSNLSHETKHSQGSTQFAPYGKFFAEPAPMFPSESAIFYQDPTPRVAFPQPSHSYPAACYDNWVPPPPFPSPQVAPPHSFSPMSSSSYPPYYS